MPNFRPAKLADIATVLPMMREFYEFEALPYDEQRSTRLLTQLINDPRNGCLILIDDAEQVSGYMIVGFGFSVEFSGRDALLDELYVRPESRGRGLGSEAIAFAISFCKADGIEALHLEADHFNTRAHDLYLRLGFKDHKRHLMTKWL